MFHGIIWLRKLAFKSRKKKRVPLPAYSCPVVILDVAPYAHSVGNAHQKLYRYGESAKAVGMRDIPRKLTEEHSAESESWDRWSEVQYTWHTQYTILYDIMKLFREGDW